MSRPWAKGWTGLIAHAVEALPRARGRPRIAAALEDAHGSFHRGVSIRVAEPSAASLCAEQVAITSMVTSGGVGPRRLVTICEKDPSPPCGRCLQLLLEVSDDVEIRWGTRELETGRSTLRRLLPLAFRDYRGER